MNVAEVVASLSNEASGVTGVLLPLCDSLIRNKVDVDLIALEWAPMNELHSSLRRFSIAFPPKRLGISPAMFRWLDSQASKRKFDLIHSHGLWMMPNVYSGDVAKKYSIPLVVSPHGTLSEWAFNNGSIGKKLFWPLLQKPALAATTCFHATAESEYEDIRRMGFKQPVAIIPNGIYIPDLPHKQSQNFRTLLFLGRIHPIKGLDILLPSWKAVQNRFPSWQLQIVGPDNRGYLTQMQQLANKLGLERITFTGALHGIEKWQAYRDADLFILPTYSENFGMSVAEALAVGTPAIVSKGAPWNGLVKKSSGWWIDIGLDPLVACLEDALSRSSDELERMGSNGRNWMDAEFSWAHVGKQMLETYSWILQKNTNKPNFIIES